MKQLTKKQFYIISALVILTLLLEHILANALITRIFTFPQETMKALIVALIGMAIWIIALVFWWKFIKKHHYLFRGNIFPLMILSILGVIFLADVILIGFNLVVPFPTCVTDPALPIEEKIRVWDQFDATGVCEGTRVDEPYTFRDELGFYAILFVIALVSYIRGRRKKRIQDMPKEKLFQ